MGNCFLCHSDKVDLYLEKNGYRFNKCAGCGLVFLENIPKNLVDYYGQGYFSGDVKLDGYMDYDNEKQISLETFEKYLNKIEELAGRAGRLLEVGCATGFFLGLAKARNWEAFGIDVSAYAVEEAKKRNLDAACAVLNDLAPEQHDKIYDVVAMFDAVEHLNSLEADFEKIKKLLKPGGLLVFATPDAGSWWARLWGRKWHAFVPPQHINLFSFKNMELFLKQRGFKVVFKGHYGKKFSLPYIFRLLHTWMGLKFFGALANFSVNNKLVKALHLPINLGDTMFVIAKLEN